MMIEQTVFWHDIRNGTNDVPTKEGVYLCCIEYPDAVRKPGLPKWEGGLWNDDEWEEGEIIRDTDTRYFGKCDSGWEMCDMPENAEMWWHEQTGSAWRERVIAWCNLPEFGG